MVSSNRIMRNLSELTTDMDSFSREVQSQKLGLFNLQSTFFAFHFKKDSVPMPPDLKKFVRTKDSLTIAKTRDTAIHIPQALSPSAGSYRIASVKLPKSITQKDVKFSDSLYRSRESVLEISSALSRARMVKNQLSNYNTNIESYKHEYRVFQIQWNKILANSIACIAMFLIGAPLGAIIKKGGLGMPVLASILFFIIFYVLIITGA